MVKEAVGEWAAKLFVEEYEHEGDLGSFVGEPVGVAFTVALQQSVSFHFAEVVTELIESVAISGDAEGCEHSGVDVFGSPATHRSAAVQESFHEADHAGVVQRLKTRLSAGALGCDYDRATGDPEPAETGRCVMVCSRRGSTSRWKGSLRGRRRKTR